MSETFQIHREILPEAQQHLWSELRPSVSMGFVLYGGTAIALRLGHRESVDFDFFTDRPLNRSTLQRAFPFFARSRILQDQPDTVTVEVPFGNNASVKVSFFGAIEFGRVGVPSLTGDRIIQVASLDDLMATKLKVLLQRVEAKDYRDIVALLNAGVSLDRGLSSTHALFGDNFQPNECLRTLVYFKGGDLDSLIQSDRETLINAVSNVRELPYVSILARNLAPASTSSHMPNP